MKKILLIVAAVALLCSCSGKSDVQKLCDFVDKVESECSSYTLDDWSNCSEKFEQIAENIDEDNCTEEEIAAAAAAAIKFYGLAAGNCLATGLDFAADEVEDALDELGEALDDLGDL